MIKLHRVPPSAVPPPPEGVHRNPRRGDPESPGTQQERGHVRPCSPELTDSQSLVFRLEARMNPKELMPLVLHPYKPTEARVLLF